MCFLIGLWIKVKKRRFSSRNARAQCKQEKSEERGLFGTHLLCDPFTFVLFLFGFYVRYVIRYVLLTDGNSFARSSILRVSSFVDSFIHPVMLS